MTMQLIQFKKVKDGKYLKNYELTYLNRAGKEKAYEIVSRRELKNAEDIGSSSSGVSIVAVKNDSFLLLKEFRLGVNKWVYNHCPGMQEENESVEECIKRELFEETGLKLVRIYDLLPPSYAAVAISDVSTQIAFVEVEGEIEDLNLSENEEIQAAFYSRKEILGLLNSGEPFSSRAQITAYLFSKGFFSVLKS